MLSGPVPDERAAAIYADALPAARITLCRLHADPAALERSGLGDLRIDTSARTPAEVTDLIARYW